MSVVWCRLEGEIPRQTASLNGVSHELHQEGIRANYTILACQIRVGKKTAPYLENPVREVARR